MKNPACFFRLSKIALLLAGCAAPALASAATPDPSFAKHAGGTLRLVAASAGGTIDPQVNYTNQYWMVFISAYDGLVTFNKTSGKASNDVVPDLAVAVPKPTDGGKTYVFTLRKGMTFSDGRPVTTADVVASFERLFKVHNPNAGSWYNNIVGGAACMTKPESCTLPEGVIGDAKANTITFHLSSRQSGIPLSARRALCFGAAGRYARQRYGHGAGAGHRRLHDHQL